MLRGVGVAPAGFVQQVLEGTAIGECVFDLRAQAGQCSRVQGQVR